MRLNAMTNSVIEFKGVLNGAFVLQVRLPIYPDCKVILANVDSKTGIFSFSMPQMVGKIPY
jgi:hypothetical protein